MNEEQQQDGALSEKRKTALLRYLGVMLVMAFLLVALSLVLQMHSSQQTISELNKNNSSALANAEQLQAQNRQLQDETRELTQTVEALQDEIRTLKQQLQELTDKQPQEQQKLDALQEELDATQTRLTGTLRAYDALITALGCETREGNLTYSRAMDIIEENRQYLSDGALAVYEALAAE